MSQEREDGQDKRSKGNVYYLRVLNKKATPKSADPYAEPFKQGVYLEFARENYLKYFLESTFESPRL